MSDIPKRLRTWAANCRADDREDIVRLCRLAADELTAQAAAIEHLQGCAQGRGLNIMQAEINRQAETIARLTAIVWKLRSIEFTQTLCAYTGKAWTRDKAPEFDAATAAMLREATEGKP